MPDNAQRRRRLEWLLEEYNDLCAHLEVAGPQSEFEAARAERTRVANALADLS